MKTPRYLVLYAACLLFFTTPVLAQDMYFGFGYGNTSTDTGIEPITAQLDEDDNGFKFFFGREVNPNFSIEGFYADLGEGCLTGENGDQFIWEGITITIGVPNASICYSATVLGGVGLFSLPINEQFSIFGKAGLALWDKEIDVVGAGSASFSDDGTDPFFGIGASYKFSPSFAVRAEYEVFDLDDNDVDMLSINLVAYLQ